MIKLITITLVCLSTLLVTQTEALSVRVVTWNVLANNWMKSKYDSVAVESLLGVLEGNNRTFQHHDIYAVTLQENCYKCDKGNKEKLANVFLQVLQRFGKYRFISIAMTRNSNTCEFIACNTFRFGTTAILIFAREGLLQAQQSFYVNKCDNKWISNSEKGIAGVRAVVTTTGRSLCFAGLHLDVSDHKVRRKCVSKFWSLAIQDYGWNTCDTVIMAGDFNTRPGPKKRDDTAYAVPWSFFGNDYFNKSLPKDEFKGELSWVGQRLLDHIQQESGYQFEEAPVTFLPTYSILTDDRCSGQKPCFKATRTPGWTDRIICSGCQSTKLYTSMWLGKSDHDPVVGIYDV